ncbi:MAG: DUF1499 domain-containing protein [Pseudomonadota bacterium]|nr:DUF1499 domain-containing protein [Pseudomonadota bacterium]
MQNKKPWYARLALILALITPGFLMACALWTKYGVIDWPLGLRAFAMGGMALVAITAILALVSIILIARKPQRTGMGSAIFALLIPLGIAAYFGPIFAGASDHPIHDMATDTATPPPLSEKVMAARAQSGANAINAYDVPLGQTDQWASADAPLSQQSYADIIAASYPELEPLLLGETDPNAAVNAVQMAMAEMGMSNIRFNEEAGTVEGLAETFWFGFKDDVVARVADGKIDFRSVSRVGISDLGANAKRIMDLRQRVAYRLDL